MHSLVIVESPTKVKTISKYLGKDYTVLSSRGHIIDLPKSGLGVDVEHNFEPEYTVIEGKGKVLTELKKAAKDVDTIILATDLDREGEAISWHVKEALSNTKGLKSKKFERVIFHEITKTALEEAFKHPGDVNYDLVDAYQARRVLDRLVGYKLSPLLWEKIRYGLSAGRVQSVGVRLIVEREREREAFKSAPYFNFQAQLTTGKEDLTAHLAVFKGETVEKQKKLQLFAGTYSVSSSIFDKKKEAEALKKVFDTHLFVVGDMEDKEVRRSPQPPLTTARLQRNAVNRFGFTSKRVMTVAQKLYENGLITYHRTDSVALSEQFLSEARTFIKKSYGKEYVPESSRYYKNGSKSAQEAHEAIRPTDVAKAPGSTEFKKLTPEQQKIYRLIWEKAVASQMADARLQQMRVDLYSNEKEPVTEGIATWRANGSRVIFPGWMKVAGAPPEEVILPVLEVGQTLKRSDIVLTEHATQPPPRYTEASLIKDLEKYGIGRPSTYANIIATILSRKYVLKDERSFVPGDTGFVVNDLLVAHFPDIVDLDFTAEMEEDLDRIARAEKKWKPVIKEFYEPFSKLLEKKKKEIKKEDVVVLEKTDEKCPVCGKPVIVKLGKYGKFYSCSDYPKCEYAAPLDTGTENGEIDQEQLKGPCPEDGGELVFKQGRFGPFIACSNYPKCKFTKPYMDKIGMPCPECKKGDVVQKKTKRGRIFYGCSRYPECEFSSWTKPGEGEKS